MTPAAGVSLGLAAGLLAAGVYGVVARRDPLGQLVGLAIAFSGVALGAGGFSLADPRRAATGAVLALVVVLLGTASIGAGAALAAVAERRAADPAGGGAAPEGAPTVPGGPSPSADPVPAGAGGEG